jgi:hypothetical protein
MRRGCGAVSNIITAAVWSMLMRARHEISPLSSKIACHQSSSVGFAAVDNASSEGGRNASTGTDPKQSQPNIMIFKTTISDCRDPTTGLTLIVGGSFNSRRYPCMCLIPTHLHPVQLNVST